MTSAKAGRRDILLSDADDHRTPVSYRESDPRSIDYLDHLGPEDAGVPVKTADPVAEPVCAKRDRLPNPYLAEIARRHI
jgi:hypothetical protein